MSKGGRVFALAQVMIWVCNALGGFATADEINTIIDEVYDQLGDLLAEEFKKTDQAIAEIRAAATDSHIAGKAVEDRVKRQLASIRKTLGTMAVDVAKANGVVTPLIRKSGDAA